MEEVKMLSEDVLKKLISPAAKALSSPAGDKAINKNKFVTNFDLKIDKFIEMLSDDKYTSYKNGKFDEENIE